MEKFEKIFGIVAVVALIMKLASLPGGAILMSSSFTGLACIYLIFGFAIFNDIKLENAFNSSSYSGISKLRILGSIGVGLLLSIVCCGILMLMMEWPGGDFVTIYVKIFSILGITLSSLAYSLGLKSSFYKAIFLRIVIVGCFGLVTFFV